MTYLNFAVAAEVTGDYGRAAQFYRKLSQGGSTLDRVGVFQAIARCYEKLGSLKKASYWHDKAGSGYLKVPRKVMSPGERSYYALVEYRSAVQDYGSGPSLRDLADRYLRTLGACLKGGKEGYSHEMLFAAHLCVKLGSSKKATGFFLECQQQFQKEGKARLAAEMRKLANRYRR